MTTPTPAALPMPSDEALVALVEKQPRICLRELCAALWPDLPWRAPRPTGDSATEGERAWTASPHLATAAQWVRERMKLLLAKGHVTSAPYRRDQPDREAGLAYNPPRRP